MRGVSMPHAALCVLGLLSYEAHDVIPIRFNAARSIVCVGTLLASLVMVVHKVFQCRTQHCVCWDAKDVQAIARDLAVSMPHAALCVLGHCVPQPLSRAG